MARTARQYEQSCFKLENFHNKRRFDMTSKQRSYLKGLAMTIDPVINIGKSGVTPELTEAVQEALDVRELIKVGILKNCTEDGNVLADMLAGRTRSSVVQVIGRKIVLYKPAKDEKKRKIILAR